MKKRIHKALRDLIGKRLWTCRRAADMAMFQFGRRDQVSDFYGQPAEVGEYALHVQCGWRILRGDGIVVGSRDLYYPVGYIDGESIPDAFDWDRDRTRRDELLDRLFEDSKREFTVRRIEVASAGACRIELDDDVCLEVFPDDSIGHEHWRLFAGADTAGAIVVTGTEP